MVRRLIQRPMTASGHSRPLHSVPVPIKCPLLLAGSTGRRSEVTLRANTRHRGNLFNDLVGHCKNFRWQIEAERCRCFKIDHEFELGCSHHW